MKQAGTFLTPEASKPNQGVIAYRDKPLTAVETEKLDGALKKYFDYGEREDSRIVPILDNAGKWIGEKFEVFRKLMVSVKLIEPPQELIEAIMRPVLPGHVMIHLFKLSNHLRFNGGRGFKDVQQDLAHDLAGKSEWAIIKACDYFRTSTGPWFPQTAGFIAKVNEFQEMAERMRDMPLGQPRTLQPIRRAEPVKTESVPWFGKFWEDMDTATRRALLKHLCTMLPAKAAQYCKYVNAPSPQSAEWNDYMESIQ